MTQILRCLPKRTFMRTVRLNLSPPRTLTPVVRYTCLQWRQWRPVAGPDSAKTAINLLPHLVIP